MKWILIFTLVITGCAQVTSLNLKKHEFGILPTKIIWFQVAGLNLEQVAMLRFQLPAERKTSFEEHNCIGQMWSYNSYALRPEAQRSFLSQMTGKKNIQNTCADAELTPIWAYLKPHGYQTGILEVAAVKNESLLDIQSCPGKGEKYLSDVYSWSRSTNPRATEFYHHLDPISMEVNKNYYSKTCRNGKCDSSITDDFKSLLSAQVNKHTKNLFILRDFSYLKALEAKNLSESRKILGDLERSMAEALKLAEKDSSVLVLLTSGDSRFIDFPDQGKAWYEYETTGKNFQVKRSQLTNVAIATGARAENFCGMFDDAQVFERILVGPKQLGLELKFINPFGN